MQLFESGDFCHEALAKTLGLFLADTRHLEQLIE